MENKRRIQIILPNHILDDLDKEATNLGLNRTTLIIQILSQYQTAKTFTANLQDLVKAIQEKR